MTKKDYKLIAEVLRHYMDSIDIAPLVDELARVFKQDNLRFNYDKFYDACGIKSKELEV